MNNNTPVQNIELFWGKIESWWDLILRSDLTKEFLGLASELSDKSVFTVLSLGLTLHNYIFFRKLEKFLKELQTAEPIKRIQEIDALQKHENQAQRGRALFVILDRLETESKAILLGRIFRAYLSGLIDYLTFQKLSTALERIKGYNLPYLLEFADGADISKEALFDLTYSGLITIPPSGFWFTQTKENREGYEINTIGQTFIKITDLHAAITDFDLSV